MTKMLIKSIMRLKLIINQIHHTYNRKLNNTRYDDSRKPMKQTNFKVKNLGGPILRRAIHYQIKVYSQEYLICNKLNYDHQT